MALKLNKFLFVLIPLLMVSACKKDDDASGGVKDFMVRSDIRTGFENNLLMITGKDGSLLYDTIGATLNKTFTFHSDGNDRVDVTRAYEYNNYFTIQTYRSVPSEFFITTLGVDCENDLNSGGFSPSESIYLTINGVSSYDELHYSFFNKEEPELNQGTNMLQLNGKKRQGEEVLVTLLINGYYKTLWVKDEDWNTSGGSTSLTVHIDDFAESVVHQIALGSDEDWIVNAEALNDDSRNVILADWNKARDNQTGESVKLFTTSDMELEKIRLSIRSTSAWSGPQYQGVVNEIPSSIDFYTSDISISNLSATHYNVVASPDHDLVKVTYQYKIGNTLYSWDVYQLAGEDAYYELPTLPDYFLENAPLINAVLESPHRIIVSDFKSYDSNVEEQYNSTSMNVMLNCLNYRGQSTFEEL